MFHWKSFNSGLFLLLLVATISNSVRAEEATQETALSEESESEVKKKPLPAQSIELVPEVLSLEVPGAWPKVKPRNKLIKYEFSLPASPGDKVPGRMTIMAAGGGVEANIARWVGQFQDQDGKPLGEKQKKIEKKKVAGTEIHVVDLTGSFQDKPRGPFGPTVERPGYRMLAVIIPLKKGGTWFVKLYGPQATMKAAEKGFQKMVLGLKIEEKV